MRTTDCHDTNSKVVSKRIFIEQLNNNTFPRLFSDVATNTYFSFAVDESTCQPQGRDMVIRDLETCSKECGCGTKTIRTECVYSDGAKQGEPVPIGSSDYECCPEPKVVTVACNMHCCPSWHTCDFNGKTCTDDSDYFSGDSCLYSECTEECGEVTKESERRCICTNTCEAEYPAEVRVGQFLPEDRQDSRVSDSDWPTLEQSPQACVLYIDYTSGTKHNPE